MTADEIHDWIDYHYWARDRVLAAAAGLAPDVLTRPLGGSFGSLLDTLVHIYFADWIWYRRWLGEPPARPDTSQLTSVQALREAWVLLEHDVRAFVGRLGPDGLLRTCAYTALSGQPATSSYWQMIVHVVNHGTYHRGQIATLLRQVGAPPAPSTDMIVFFREREAASK